MCRFCIGAGQYNHCGSYSGGSGVSGGALCMSSRYAGYLKEIIGGTRGLKPGTTRFIAKACEAQVIPHRHPQEEAIDFDAVDEIIEENDCPVVISYNLME